MIIYDLIFKTLKENKIDVFSPGSHLGECTKPYVVVKQDTGARYANYSTQMVLYDILCYAKNYTDCLNLKEKVKNIMKLTGDSVRPTYNETQAYYDDTVKAYMASVEYRNYRKVD